MSTCDDDRIARNEAVFRDVNEAIRAGRWPNEDGPVAFRCECASIGCADLVEMTLPEYEEVRSDSRRFFVKPGHEVLYAETPVVRRNGYVVVEKIGEAATVAEQLDPRP